MKNRLKEVRESIGLNQTQFGKKLSYSKSAISHFEHGVRQLSYETALKIEQYYGVSAEYIMGRNLQENKYGNMLTNEETELLELARSLPEKTLKYIKSLMKRLK